VFWAEVVEKIKTHISCSITFFFNHAVYEIVWKNVEWDRPLTTIWHMLHTCWILKATNTLAEYVILVALPLQKLLYICTLMLHYTFNPKCVA